MSSHSHITLLKEIFDSDNRLEKNCHFNGTLPLGIGGDFNEILLNRKWYVQDSDAFCRILPSKSGDTPKDSLELQPWNYTALSLSLSASNPKLNFLLCRMLLAEKEPGRTGWEGGRCSLNLLTFTACCSIKPCGQDRTPTRLPRDDKLAVLPDAWLPDLYSLSGSGGGGGSVCVCVRGGWQR